MLATEGVDRSPQSGHGTWWALVDRMALGVRTPGFDTPPHLFLEVSSDPGTDMDAPLTIGTMAVRIWDECFGPKETTHGNADPERRRPISLDRGLAVKNTSKTAQEVSKRVYVFTDTDTVSYPDMVSW